MTMFMGLDVHETTFQPEQSSLQSTIVIMTMIDLWEAGKSPEQRVTVGHN